MTVTVRNQALGVYRLTFTNPIRGTVVELWGTQIGMATGKSAVASIVTTHDFNRRLAQAEIQLNQLPAGVGYWDEVTIDMGATPATVARRFHGYVVPLGTQLSPKSGTLTCRGRLIRADRKPCGVYGGMAYDSTSGLWSASPATFGGTEVQMIGAALTVCGLNTVPGYLLGGTGRVLGTCAATPSGILLEQYTPYAIGEKESWLAFIARLDEISVAQDSNGTWGAYRTYDGRLGQILRSLITPVPAASPRATFTEGTDIRCGSWGGDPGQARTRVRVSGFTYPGGTSIAGLSVTQVIYPTSGTTYFSQSNPVVDPFGDNPSDDFSSPLIELGAASEVASTSGGNSGISCEEVARYTMARDNRVLEVVPFTTPRDDPLDTAQTIQVNSPNRLGISGLYWIGTLSCRLDARGWSMDINGVGGSGSSAPFDPGVQGGFDLLVEQETVVVSGAEQTLYVVSCTPGMFSASAAMSSYSWTATGGTPSSGSGSTFVTSYTSLSGQTISLTGTDANGKTLTVSKTVPSSGQTTVVRRALYLAGTDTLDVLDPTPSAETWRTHSATTGTVTTNAPVWADGDTVWRTTDDGVTWSSSKPESGTNVTALWVETDVDSSQVLAGLNDGSVYRSADSGASWSSAGAPSGSPVLCVVINRYADLQWFALTAAGLWQSLDGSTWSQLQTAAGGETFRDVAFSWDRGYMVVMSGGRLAIDSGGVTQTFPTNSGDIQALTARILGGYFAYDSAGRTFGETSGATSFTAGAALPTGLVVQQRGLWRDGVIADLLYVAGGAGGCWKSLDGFGSSGGYFQIRKPGVGSSPAGAVYSELGSDGLLSSAKLATPAAPVIFVSAVGAEQAYDNGTSGAGPANWQDASFDHTTSGWTASVADTGGAGMPPPPSGSAYVTKSSTSFAGAERFLFYRGLSVPGGAISSATLQIAADNYIEALWVNDQLMPVDPTIDSLVQTATLPPSAFLPGQTNALAIQVKNKPFGGNNVLRVAYRLALS